MDGNRDPLRREPLAPAEKAFFEAQNDLVWLANHGALAGVAALLQERRRQIETLGYRLEHDSSAHADGMLLHMARKYLVDLAVARDKGRTYVESENGLGKGGALVAAEIDRLSRAAAQSQVLPPT
jgi:hypothetical protein